VTTPFFLIDFENVQPKALGRLKPGASRVMVFLGEQQKKLEVELVKALQPFGQNATYVQIHGHGPDAVDFHIAFYIGRLSAAHPGATFHIVSKDTGFDPLVKHLNAQGIACKRVAEIPGSTATTPTPAGAKPATPKPPAAVVVTVPPEPKAAAPTPATAVDKPAVAKSVSASAHAKEAVARLRKSTRPATWAKLRSTIKSWFQLEDKGVDAVLQSLRDSKKIALDGTRVAYSLD